MTPLNLIEVVKSSDRSDDTNKREIRLEVNSSYCPFYVYIVSDICYLWKLISSLYGAIVKTYYYHDFTDQVESIIYKFK